MKIILVLSANYIDIYKQNTDFENLVDSYNSGASRLDLSNNFEKIWKKNIITIQSATNIELVLLPKSSFTDTRVVSIWIRSHCMFNKNTTFVFKQNLSESSTIQYSNQPKIGKH